VPFPSPIQGDRDFFPAKQTGFVPVDVKPIDSGREVGTAGGGIEGGGTDYLRSSFARHNRS